jgi:probable F420-dependent oxidoreductase
MELGLAILLTDYSMAPAALGASAEERGFESLFLAEHTHIPVSRDTPYPGGTPLPREYSHTIDPFVGLAAAATATERLRVGTGVCLVIERDPIVTAKEVATLDQISGGRLLFGVGAGWNIEELRHHGTDPKTRGALLDERIEAIRALWTTEPAEYHGRYVDFDSSYLRPKPVQKPHPPIYIGGDSDATVKRIVRHEAGWISNPLPADHLSKRIDQIREGAGHDVPLAQFGTPDDLDYWRAVEDLGFGQVALLLPTKPLDESLRLLDEYAAHVSAYRG